MRIIGYDSGHFFSIYQTSKLATINHAIIENINQWFENPGKTPFIKNIIPFNAIIPPTLRERGQY